MPSLGLPEKIENVAVLKATKEHFRNRNIKLPTFSELRDPKSIPQDIQDKLKDVDPDEPHPLNLYRVHWYNDPKDKSKFLDVPFFYQLPKALTGIDAKIVVMIGAWFPMVNCQKVIAAYGCLAPRVITGQFDPTVHRAVWPSTGNYCRGGIAISKIMDCNGVAILPEEMSEERFSWLRRWTKDFDKDVYKTYGCESNVKEIYDKCNELDSTPENIIFNQFSEFGNTVAHYHCTGTALQNVFEEVNRRNGGKLNLRAYTGATGSAGTLASADYLKEHYKTESNRFDIVAVEAVECPTLLYNGFGGHNIQGIGDKHVPLVHNVMNTDFVAGISDKATDCLSLLFGTDAGKKYLKEKKGLTEHDFFCLDQFGYSALANTLAAIKTAKYHGMGANDVVVTVATDPAWMYASETKMAMDKYFNGNFDEVDAAEVFGEHLSGCRTDHLEELTLRGKERIFNLGYYTWVEQQGISVEDFMQRKDQKWWKDLRSKFLPIWERLINDFNGTAANVAGQSKL